MLLMRVRNLEYGRKDVRKKVINLDAQEIDRIEKKHGVRPVSEHIFTTNFYGKGKDKWNEHFIDFNPDAVNQREWLFYITNYEENWEPVDVENHKKRIELTAKISNAKYELETTVSKTYTTTRFSYAENQFQREIYLEAIALLEKALKLESKQQEQKQLAIKYYKAHKDFDLIVNDTSKNKYEFRFSAEGGTVARFIYRDYEGRWEQADMYHNFTTVTDLHRYLEYTEKEIEILAK